MSARRGHRRDKQRVYYQSACRSVARLRIDYDDDVAPRWFTTVPGTSDVGSRRAGSCWVGGLWLLLKGHINKDSRVTAWIQQGYV